MISLICANIYIQFTDPDLMKYCFPKDFIWGTATSAFQTEMGTSKDSISDSSDWYVWVHDKDNIKSGLVSGDLPENGDDFWNLYKTDLDNAKSLNNNSIRLSIDWARIFKKPTFEIKARVRKEKGLSVEVSLTDNDINSLEDLADINAVKHYNEIFTYAKSLGLKVLLTLYHWPLPAWLHDPIKCQRDMENCTKKGWLDETTIIEYAKYVEYATRHFSKDVYMWETINEPEVIAFQGYIFGNVSGFPPGLSNISTGFVALKNLALANNIAMKIIKKNDPGKPAGVGTNPSYYESYSNDRKSRELTQYIKYLNNFWFLNAAVYGDFDLDLDGKGDLRIDSITSPDYIGIDYYRRMKIQPKNISGDISIYNSDVMPCNDCTDFMWDIYPAGIRSVVLENYQEYKKPIYILENGIADATDSKRTIYMVSHLKELSKAINDDSLPVKGYYHWSLIDNYEWARGFSMKFGLYAVNYETKKRMMRKSAKVYTKICRDNGVDENQ